jgi:DNA-binding transcriptional LysR family regulator
MDLALSEVEPTVERFAARVFTHDSYRAIVPAKHPLAKLKAVTPDQLAAAGLITRRSEAAGGSFVERSLRFAAPPTLQLDSTESIKQAVAAGLGVAIVSGLAVASPDPRLAVRALKGVSLRRPLYAVRPRAGAEGEPLTAFLQMLKHAAAGSLPPLEKPITPAK